MSTPTLTDADAIARVKPRLENVTISGDKLSARCPVHITEHPSQRPFSMDMETGQAKCWSPKCGWKGNAQSLAAELGLDMPDPKRNGGTPETRYEVRDTDSKLVAVHVRKDTNGDKRFWWERDGTTGLKGLPSTALPLYGAERLASLEDGAGVVLVEGEKPAGALMARGIPAVATVCGAAATPRDEALRPLVRLSVTLWPDADEPGEAHMQRIGAALQRLGCADLRIVHWADAPDKGDAADFGGTNRELLEILNNPERFHATGPDGQNFTSALYIDSAEVSTGPREKNAGELQRQAREDGAFELDYLTVLKTPGLFVRGWSHLFAAFPKTGKTELMTRVIGEWTSDRVLYITEEPEAVWATRLAKRPDDYKHVTLFFGMGVPREEMLSRILSGTETVVVIDSIRSLFGLEDEKNNSEIARAVIPYIVAARRSGKTPVFVHHDRKGGGQDGEGIAGGHAFLAVVDVALELLRDRTPNRRRIIRGWGRVIEVPGLMYEMADNGDLVALGNPADVAVEDVKGRLLDVITNEWQSATKLRAALGDPQPSTDTVGRALISLGAGGRIERDPPLSVGKTQGKRQVWRRTPENQELPLKEPYSGSEVEEAEQATLMDIAAPENNLHP